MRRKLLESIADRGALLAMWWSDSEAFSQYDFLKQIQALCENRAGLLVDLGGWLNDLAPQPDCGMLFARKVQLGPETTGTWQGLATLAPSPAPYATDAASWRFLIGNLQNAQERYPFVVMLLPRQWQPFMGPALAASTLAVCTASNVSEANELAQHLEKLHKPDTLSLWWSSAKPDPSAYPQLAKAQKSWGTLAAHTTDSHLLWRDLIRIRILLRNPPEGWLFTASKLGWLATLLLCLLPFWPVSDLGHPISGLRDLSEDKARFSEASYIQLEFNGQEPLQRIARYAIGRYTALVTHEAMVAGYVKETLARNSLSDSGWQKQDPLLFPPKGTQIRFYPPESIKNPRYEVNAPAWRFFTGMLTDSIAYLTEFYHESETANQRKHDGIDIGSRMGARILAPFSAKAWTAKDDRGGVIIGLVRGDDVMLFMHCDQLLYLDGQEVMEGDPIATVGMTGHTTGPHVHLASGLVSKNGSRSIGPVRYNPMDPLEWYRVQAKRKLRGSGF